MLRSLLTGPNCTGGHDQNCVRVGGQYGCTVDWNGVTAKRY